MPIFSRACLLALTGWATLSPVAAWALDGTETPALSRVAPARAFKNAADALRQGLEADRAGDVKSSLAALEYAADGGRSLALWKLGKMYADGEGVPHDDLKAYQYFSRIVENYDEDDPNRREMSVVASAFVAVGVYMLNGIAKTSVEADPERAMRLFQFAATNFGSAHAQYNLARMFLDGQGVEKDIRQAARWLSLAAEKNHYQAQAVLGQLLFNGGDGIARQRARGLMWLSLAREGVADAKKDAWVLKLSADALNAASDNDRQAAQVYLSGRTKKAAN